MKRKEKKAEKKLKEPEKKTRSLGRFLKNKKEGKQKIN